MATKRNGSKQKSKKRSLKFKIFKYISILLLLLAVTCCALLYSVYCGMWGALPTNEELKEIKNYEASSLYSNDGMLLGKYYIENRTNVNYNTISENAVQALIATEDVRFYKHKGLDQVSLIRVFFKTLLLGDRSSGGGSTISQQLAKNLFPREEQNTKIIPIIKLKEIFTAYKLENLYSKEEILALYLNTVFFGDNTYGIESAAQTFFSTSASYLTVSEAATLIGLLKGPSYYNPRLFPERALQRRNTVINQMMKYDYLTQEVGEKLKNDELQLRFKSLNRYSGLAPYLREKIRQDAANIIRDYNQVQHTDYNLYKDGLILTTTLDAEMQRYAEEAVAKHMKSLQNSYYTHLGKKEPWNNNPALLENAIKKSSTYIDLKEKGLADKEIRKIMNEKKPMMIYSPYQGETRMEMSTIDSLKHYLKIFQAGLIAVEPQTGKIKAWVGGLNYKYFQYDQVDAARQVGSVFKPVTYSAALTHGASTNAYYKNEQKSYPKYEDWTPRNSDDNYEGYYTLKGALSKSINTIAVDVLLQTGIDTVIQHARRLNIAADLPPYPSLALGVADIPLRQMVNPYICYANNGKLPETYYLSEIKDKAGNIIYQAGNRTVKEVMTAEEANIMTDMLTAVIESGTGHKLRTTYGLGVDMAGKTGTTQNQVDGWFIGYTPKIVVGIRVGAENNGVHFNSLSLGQGASMALPIFGLFMQECLQSPTYAPWNQLSFSLIIPASSKEVTPFKENLNFIEKIMNRKMDKITPLFNRPAEDEPTKEKGFFRKIGNLFRKEKK